MTQFNLKPLFKGITSFVVVLGMFFVAPVNAAPVFSDNFNTENGGVTLLNYSSFINFNSTGAGDVDLIATGVFGITCPDGVCVDLDGSPGPGSLQSKASFAFGAGDFVRLSADVSGNQRGGASDLLRMGFLFGGVTTQMFDIGINNGAGDIILSSSLLDTGFLTDIGTLSSADPFLNRSVFFTAGSSGSLTFNFGTPSNDNVGPIADNILLDITRASVPEPSILFLLGIGLLGLGITRNRQFKV